MGVVWEWRSHHKSDFMGISPSFIGVTFLARHIIETSGGWLVIASGIVQPFIFIYWG